jgi:hypothetical protein
VTAKKKKYVCRHEEGDRHDCKYVDEINALIPAAEIAARRQAYKLHPVDHHAQQLAFAKLFHSEMDARCEEKGLRKRLPRTAS